MLTHSIYYLNLTLITNNSMSGLIPILYIGLMIYAVLVSFLKFIDFYLESDCDLYMVPSAAARDIERAMS